MSENLEILRKKLDNLARMRADVQHSISKMPGPLATIKNGDVSVLTLDQRETLSAFTTRFATYQEQIGKSMRGVALEEESATSPFGAILSLMEKLSILDDPEKWKLVRGLRNAVNHEYEDDAGELYQLLSSMVESAPWLFSLHENIVSFVNENYRL